MATRQVYKNFSKSASPLTDLYILSAVRTPFGSLSGVLNKFTAPQLGSFAIKEALQRAVVPSKDLQNIFLGCLSHENCIEEIFKRTGLSNETKISISKCGVKSLIEAVRFLQLNNKNVIMASGVESFTNPSPDTLLHGKSNNETLKEINKYFRRNHIDSIGANKNRQFKNEILKIDFRKKGQHIIVDKDEICLEQKKDSVNSSLKCDGAAAFIISSPEYVKENSLVPLGKIISFVEKPSHLRELTSVIDEALRVAGCQSKDIARWEFISENPRDFININLPHATMDRSTFSLGYPIGMSGLKGVCHLIHSLSTEELGCVAAVNFNDTTSVIIIKKLDGCKSSKPQLILYTKHPCPLCDELKQELKAFEGRFSLLEVDIEKKEHQKYKELYEYEIPVLFLDGVYLCKHQLDVQLLNFRLLESEKENS